MLLFCIALLVLVFSCAAQIQKGLGEGCFVRTNPCTGLVPLYCQPVIRQHFIDFGLTLFHNCLTR
jgi:hypothetical protein